MSSKHSESAYANEKSDNPIISSSNGNPKSNVITPPVTQTTARSENHDPICLKYTVTALILVIVQAILFIAYSVVYFNPTFGSPDYTEYDIILFVIFSMFSLGNIYLTTSETDELKINVLSLTYHDFSQDSYYNALQYVFCAVVLCPWDIFINTTRTTQREVSQNLEHIILGFKLAIITCAALMTMIAVRCDVAVVEDTLKSLRESFVEMTPLDLIYRESNTLFNDLDEDAKKAINERKHNFVRLLLKDLGKKDNKLFPVRKIIGTKIKTSFLFAIIMVLLAATIVLKEDAIGPLDAAWSLSVLLQFVSPIYQANRYNRLIDKVSRMAGEGGDVLVKLQIFQGVHKYLLDTITVNGVVAVMVSIFTYFVDF